MLDKFRAGEAEAQFNEFLLPIMDNVGIPKEKIDVYRKVVLKEWENKAESEFLASYAAITDFSSPDYREEIENHNKRLVEIRTAMTTTSQGKKTILDMQSKRVDDGFSTIPLPPLSSFEPAVEIQHNLVLGLGGAIK